MSRPRFKHTQITVLLCMVISGITASYAKDNIRIEASLSSDRIYEGEPVALSVSLTTTNPDIAYVELDSPEDYPGFSVLNAPIADTGEGRLRRVADGGQDAFRAVIYRIMLMPNSSGTLTIPSLRFNIGIRRLTTIDHPFFGPMRSSSVDGISLSTKSLKVKCIRLPQAVNGYSGAIGDFTFDGSVPPGKIYADNPALVVFRISGIGYIDSASFPDIRAYLPEGLSLKSDEESSDFRCVGDELQSAIEIECTLVAGKAGEYTIPPIPFTFFDPASRSYRTVSTKSLTIKAESLDIPSKPKVLHSI